jgi:cytochrome P450
MMEFSGPAYLTNKSEASDSIGASTKLPPRCDLFAVGEDPYRQFADLREAAPLLRGRGGVWVLTRYHEIAMALRSESLGQFRFQANPAQQASSVSDSPAQKLLNNIVVTRDGAQHARWRAILSAALTTRRIEALRAETEDRVAQLLEAPAEAGSFDALAELGYPLPIYVLSRLFAVPEQELDGLGRKILSLSKLFSPEVAPADRAAADTAVTVLQDYFTRLCDERSRRPRADLISALVAEGQIDQLDPAGIADNAIFLMFAGLETTMNLIAAGCAAFAKHPSQLARLRDRSVGALTAAHECLRYDPPTQITGRIVLRTVEIAGRTLRENRIVLLAIASANRDPRQFRDPDVFDVGRDPNPHVSFGAGPHYCVGARLALLEAQIVFDSVARRFALFAPAAPAIREPIVTTRAYLKVPVTVRPVARL